ncbi:MAG TPA: hypothetical protein VLE53_16410 [Gemmatimonadaceae bacterium]|nr:hypothetical protein [Gemmatimonadaceae bacterium]
MFVRTPYHPAEVWQRFVLPDEGFEFGGAAPLWRARVVAPGERALSLFHDLAAELGPAIGVRIDDTRGKRKGDAVHWRGDALDRDRVRAGIASIRGPLARYAGVEIALYDDEDQLTLRPWLDLGIHARTPRWYHLLRGLGLTRYAAIPHRSWRPDHAGFPPAPVLDDLLRELVRRLDPGTP